MSRGDIIRNERRMLSAAASLMKSPPRGWIDPVVTPVAAGIYERLSMLGVGEYRWDGRLWWSRTPSGYRTRRFSILAANQQLPWRRLTVLADL